MNTKASNSVLRLQCLHSIFRANLWVRLRVERVFLQLIQWKSMLSIDTLFLFYSSYFVAHILMLQDNEFAYSQKLMALSNSTFLRKTIISYLLNRMTYLWIRWPLENILNFIQYKTSQTCSNINLTWKYAFNLVNIIGIGIFVSEKKKKISIQTPSQVKTLSDCEQRNSNLSKFLSTVFLFLSQSK